MKIIPAELVPSSLFAEISEPEIQKICQCLAMQKKSYPKDAFIFHAGDEVTQVFLILSGHVHITNEDFWGNQTIVEAMGAYTLFGEAYVLAGEKRHLVNVMAAEDAEILVIDPARLYQTCCAECAFHHQLIKNITVILSKKIVLLTQKLGHLVERTTREKLLSYLSSYARQVGSSSFFIPYTRQQLANYLSVERSALSHELSRMRQAGIMKCRKNHFELLRADKEDAR